MLDNENEVKNTAEDDEMRPQMMIVSLLFREKPQALSVEGIRAALEKRLGSLGDVPYVEPSVSSKADMIMFPITKYKAILKDKPEGVPPLACFLGPMEFSTDNIDDMKRSQFWDVKNGNELIDSCKWHISVHAMLSAALYYKEQAELLMAQVYAVLDCCPECCAVYSPMTGKLTYTDYVREVEDNELAVKFTRTYVNARFFNIEGTEDDMVVDTVGFNAFLGADVQVHYHGLDPNYVVEYVYNLALYQFNNDFPIKSGETVDSIDENGKIQWEPQWQTQYENSLIDPMRTVLDINCGEYAAGNRNN